MRIRIKTASKEAEIAVICMLRTEIGQIVALTYSAGMHIVLEQLTANIFSPLFPLEDILEIENILKLNNFEKGVSMNIGIERLSEEEMSKILNNDIYSIYYKKKGLYFDLVKFESEALETSHNVFFQNFPQNLLVMQQVDIESDFSMDNILDRIQNVGMKNITKLEKDYLQRISKQD